MGKGRGCRQGEAGYATWGRVILRRVQTQTEIQTGSVRAVEARRGLRKVCESCRR